MNRRVMRVMRGRRLMRTRSKRLELEESDVAKQN